VPSHDAELAKAFDGQAARFERSPVQTDPAALAQLIAFAALPAGSLVLDAGCGPGIVCEAFLEAGHRVHGVDLSPEMVRRARERCSRFGDSARFERVSIADLAAPAAFDAGVSRFVLHHVVDPVAFLRAEAARLRPGGVLIACDQVTDPDPAAARWHQEIECARDRTHVRNLTSGELVDAFGRAGLRGVRLEEDPFELDFDEWFDRGTPALDKAEVRRRIRDGAARGFAPRDHDDGRISIRCLRALARGIRADL
jgi:SAM-dependent methyltransferase